MSSESDPAFNAEVDLTADGIDFLDIKDPKQMAIYQRRMVAGEKIRLPTVPTVPDDLWYTFEHGFMQLKDDTGEIAKVFRYFWEPENAEITKYTVPYGVAGNINHIVKMVEAGRITPDDAKVDDTAPTATMWDKIKRLTAANYTMVDIKREDTTTLAKQSDNVLKIIDAIVNFLTNNYYVIPAELEGGAHGLIAEMYFADFATNLKIMRQVYSEGKDGLPFDMAAGFKAGMYADYKQTLAAVKRRYGRCKTQDTMMDLFRKLDKALSEKTRRMNSK